MGVFPTSCVMSSATPPTAAGAGAAADELTPASVTRVFATRVMMGLLLLLLLLLLRPFKLLLLLLLVPWVISRGYGF